MSSVYSGGQVYEYSEEGNGYGIVNIEGGSVSEPEDFVALQSALAAVEDPSGDGGYNVTSHASEVLPDRFLTGTLKVTLSPPYPSRPKGS